MVAKSMKTDKAACNFYLCENHDNVYLELQKLCNEQLQ